MTKRVYFATKNIHRVVPGSNKHISALRESYEFITSCDLRPNVKVGSAKCRECRFCRGSDMFNKEIARHLATDSEGREVGILIRRSYISCACERSQREQATVISKHVDSIKSIW